MDSIKEKTTIDSFPFASLRRFRNTFPANLNRTSTFTANSYDNRSRVSSVAGSLRSKLGFMQTRLTSNSFLSNSFSWLVNTAVTNDPDRLLATASSTAEKKTYSLEIDSIATAQEAVSDRLESDSFTDFDEGTYTFDLSVDSTTYSLEVDISRHEQKGVMPTNYDVLQDIEREINNLGVDVTAELHEIQTQDYAPYREGEFKGVSYLTVTADETGEQVDFSLSDTSGDLIQTLNLDDKRQTGAKNQYRLDGTQENTDSNTISIDSGQIAGYMMGTTETGENLQISVIPGRQELADELTRIIGNYNELITWIDSNDSIISPSLKKALFSDLDSISVNGSTLKKQSAKDSSAISGIKTGYTSVVTHDNDHSTDNQLENIGLTLNADGTIDISDDFDSAVASDLWSVYRSLAGDSGFFTKISQAIDDIHGKNEQGYVFSRNSIISYKTDTTGLQSQYDISTANIINLFA